MCRNDVYDAIEVSEASMEDDQNDWQSLGSGLQSTIGLHVRAEETWSHRRHRTDSSHSHRPVMMCEVIELHLLLRPWFHFRTGMANCKRLLSDDVLQWWVNIMATSEHRKKRPPSSDIFSYQADEYSYGTTINSAQSDVTCRSGAETDLNRWRILSTDRLAASKKESFLQILATVRHRHAVTSPKQLYCNTLSTVLVTWR